MSAITAIPPCRTLWITSPLPRAGARTSDAAPRSLPSALAAAEDMNRAAQRQHRARNGATIIAHAAAGRSVVPNDALLLVVSFGNLSHAQGCRSLQLFADAAIRPRQVEESAHGS